MELIYTDGNWIEAGSIKDYELDLAYGADENDFEMKIPLEDHKLTEDCLIYIEGTEYGGIIDGISPDDKTQMVTYTGRSWHGVLESKVIEPEEGQDNLMLYGDANEVLQELIKRMGLENIFVASGALSEIEIYAYQMPRYVRGYTGICKMLERVDAKLKMEYHEKYVVLEAVPLVDYSQDEEFDASQITFTITKNYNPVTHIICAGQGEGAERYVIHIFADKNGGIQPYAKTDMPLQDADYILDKSQQYLTGTDDSVEFYDYGNAGAVENYIQLTTQPSDWRSNLDAYYVYNEDRNSYESAKEENGEKYTALTSQPGDWTEQYTSYYQANGTGGYKSAEGVSRDTYKRLTSKPRYWDKTYQDYYYYYTDGVTSEYRSVSGVTKEYYKVQTKKPTDWSKEFGSYYKRKSKGKGYETVKGTGKKKNKAPTWKPKKYFTKLSVTKVPQWKNTYYSKTTTVSTPTFVSGKYFSRSQTYKAPSFAAGKYYKKVLDHYAQMVEKAIEKLESYSVACDQIDIDFSGSDKVYDIGDIVGAAEPITGIEVWQPISKKIVTIKNSEEMIVSYEVGTGGK